MIEPPHRIDSQLVTETVMGYVGDSSIQYGR